MNFVYDGVDASIARDVSLIVDNDRRAYFTLRQACIDSVVNDDAATNDIDDDIGYTYGEAHAGRDDDSWRTIVECAGLRVADAMIDLLSEDGAESLAYALLVQILDFTNHALWAEIAEGLMPDPDDVFGEDE